MHLAGHLGSTVGALELAVWDGEPLVLPQASSEWQGSLADRQGMCHGDDFLVEGTLSELEEFDRCLKAKCETNQIGIIGFEDNIAKMGDRIKNAQGVQRDQDSEPHGEDS